MNSNKGESLLASSNTRGGSPTRVNKVVEGLVNPWNKIQASRFQLTTIGPDMI